MVVGKRTRLLKLQPGQKKGVCTIKLTNGNSWLKYYNGLFCFGRDHFCFISFLVPSRAPSNINLTNVGSTEVTVHWSRLPQQYANGRLLGYRVYFRKTTYYPYYVPSNTSIVNVTSPNATRVILTELTPGQRYRIYVSAFTSKGEGPRSYGYHVTTGRSTLTEDRVFNQQNASNCN